MINKNRIKPQLSPSPLLALAVMKNCCSLENEYKVIVGCKRKYLLSKVNTWTEERVWTTVHRYFWVTLCVNVPVVREECFVAGNSWMSQEQLWWQTCRKSNSHKPVTLTLPLKVYTSVTPYTLNIRRKKEKKKILHKSESWYQCDHKSQTCKNGLKLPKAHKKVMNKMFILKASWREKELSEPQRFWESVRLWKCCCSFCFLPPLAPLFL